MVLRMSRVMPCIEPWSSNVFRIYQFSSSQDVRTGDEVCCRNKHKKNLFLNSIRHNSPISDSHFCVRNGNNGVQHSREYLAMIMQMGEHSQEDTSNFIACTKVKLRTRFSHVYRSFNMSRPKVHPQCKFIWTRTIWTSAEWNQGLWGQYSNKCLVHKVVHQEWV